MLTDRPAGEHVEPVRSLRALRVATRGADVVLELVAAGRTALFQPGEDVGQWREGELQVSVAGGEPCGGVDAGGLGR